MKIQVRNAVFETNSSSTHSVTVAPDETYVPGLSKETLRKGVIEVRPHGYGWEWMRYYTPEEKISYLLAQTCAAAIAKMPAGKDCSDRLKEESPRARQLLEAVEKESGCKVAVYAPAGGFDDMVYIDDDSQGVGMELFSSRKKLARFVLSQDSYVQTGNDNTHSSEFIENDRGGSEEFYAQHYASVSEHECGFRIKINGMMSEIAFSAGDFEIEVKSEWGSRAGHLVREMSGVTCDGGTVYVNGSRGAAAKERAGRDMLLAFISDLNEYETAEVKLLRSARLTIIDAGLGHEEAYLGDCRFDLKCRASAETVEAMKSALVDLGSALRGPGH